MSEELIILNEKLDKILSNQKLIITETDLREWLLEAGCNLTSKSVEDNMIEFGFPFSSHEENELKGYIFVHPRGNSEMSIKNMLLYFASAYGKLIIKDSNILKP